MIPAGVGILAVYIVKYNPFDVQAMLMRDYLEARRTLREKSRPIEDKPVVNTRSQKKEELEAETSEDGSRTEGKYSEASVQKTC